MYVVINKSLHHDSSYQDVIGFFEDERDAVTCMGTSFQDTIKEIDRNEFGDDFQSDRLRLELNDYNCLIKDKKTGYFEYFEIFSSIDE